MQPGTGTQPKRGGSARPVSNKQNGIIMGSGHGITSQVAPKDGGPAKAMTGGTIGKTSKSTRGESPTVHGQQTAATTNSGRGGRNSNFYGKGGST